MNASLALVTGALLTLVYVACGRESPTASGSASCAACHEAQYLAWQKSHHALAERELTRGEVTVRDIGPDGEFHDYPALRAIGVSPLVQYVVVLDGHLQVAQQAKDSRDGSWFNVFDDGRQPGEWGHWTGRGMNWDTMCAVCHNTGVTRDWSAKLDRFTTTWQEHGVGCGACHTEDAEHQSQPLLSSAPFQMDTCLSCHARRTGIAPLQPGVPFLDVALPAFPDLSEDWYADGQIHAEDFEASSFLLSQMANAGVTCLDCHDPHSGKPRAEGNALCLSCHSGGGRLPAPVIDASAHSQHEEGSAGNSCIACHMPTTTYMQRHARHDHGFLRPDPSLSRQLGTPLACDRCHQDKDAEWAAQQMTTRVLASGSGRARLRAEAIHAARSGVDDAKDLLQVALQKEEHPVWRGVLYNILVSLGTESSTRADLLALNMSNPWERLFALATPELLADPLRGVRLRAARQILGTVALESRAGQDLLQAILLHRGQPTGAMEEAQFLFLRGAFEKSITLTRWAQQWEPTSPAPWHLRSSALDAVGREAEALTELNLCCARFPEDATSFYLLGLAASAEGDYVGSVSALQRALSLQPNFPAAARNLRALQIFLAD